MNEIGASAGLARPTEGTGTVAYQRMTLEEIRANPPVVDHAKIAATADEDIGRHQIEDGEDPYAPLPPARPMPEIRSIRERLAMTQEAFADAIGVPVAMLRNREQSRTIMNPAARSLLRVIDREPEAALRALAESADPADRDSARG